MTPKEQADFVTQLAETVAEEMVVKILSGKTPENWDGHELRLWMKDRFALVSWGDMENKRSKRYRGYKNTVLVNDLL